MNESNCSELNELNQNENPELEDEIYQNQYINAIMLCYPDIEDQLIEAQRDGRYPV